MNDGFNPKVSIIIPVYNGSRYLREAIDSALGQSYPNVEVIVVNDGSSDNGATENIALSYGKRIRYFSKQNGGVSTALNLGIKKMKGVYFSWLSHDDVYYPNKIEMQIKYLAQHNPKDTILYGGYALIDESSNVTSYIKPNRLYPEEKLNISLFPIMRGLINGCSLLIHKSHFERVGLFDEKLLLVQDYTLWFKMFRNAKVKFLPGIFVKNRFHNAQQSKKKKQRFLEESNTMWISFIDNVSVKEMCEMDGSPYLYYQNTAVFLKEYSINIKAQQHAESLAMKAMGKISIIIPFFNRIPTLIEAIDSVLSQSYKNIEVLLIDDGSTDNLNTLKKIEDPRLHYVYQEHQGVSAARNLGISLSTGEYIAFLDSDDLFIAGKLEKQIKFMYSYNLLFSHTSYQRINMQGKPMEIINSGRISGKIFPHILACCGIATSTVMIKKEILNDKKFKETVELGEDVCLWIDIAYNHLVGGIDETLTKVRVGPNTSIFNVNKQRLAYLNIADHIIKNPLYVANEKEIHFLLRDFSNLFKPTQSKPPANFFKHTQSSQSLNKAQIRSKSQRKQRMKP